MSDKNELDKSDDSWSYSESDSDCSGSLIGHRHCPSPMDTRNGAPYSVSLMNHSDGGG